MQNQDYRKPGVVFCFETVGKKYTEASPHFPQTTYYFGCTQNAFASILPVADSEKQVTLIKKRMKRDGLNAPREMLMWVRARDIYEFWDLLKYGLIWSKHPLGFPWANDKVPKVVRHQDVGDRYFSVTNMDSKEFGKWLHKCGTCITKQMQGSQ